MGFAKEMCKSKDYTAPRSWSEYHEFTPVKLVNLTPHAITVVIKHNYKPENLVIPPSGAVARVSTVSGKAEDPIFTLQLPHPTRPETHVNVTRARIAIAPHPTYGEVEGLPVPAPNTLYIVSGMVLAHCAGRTDVFGPGTGPNDDPIRNDAGHIVAVTRLIAAPEHR